MLGVAALLVGLSHARDERRKRGLSK
jgi:hypothetical protein